MTRSLFKNCMKCMAEKPLSGFYRHPRMDDGRLNKCIECTKRDVSANRLKNHSYYLEYDRERAGLPHRRRARKAYAETPQGLQASRAGRARWDARNKHKKAAHGIVSRALVAGVLEKKPCQVCGDVRTEAHHPDYNQPLHVIWLCKPHHDQEHVQIRRSKSG